MKKRIFSLLLAIILLSGSIPVSALEALGETMLPTSVADSNTIEQPPQEGPKEEMPSGDSEPSSSSQAGDGSSTSASEDNSSSESASEESSSSTPEEEDPQLEGRADRGLSLYGGADRSSGRWAAP